MSRKIKDLTRADFILTGGMLLTFAIITGCVWYIGVPTPKFDDPKYSAVADKISGDIDGPVKE